MRTTHCPAAALTAALFIFMPMPAADAFGHISHKVKPSYSASNLPAQNTEKESPLSQDQTLSMLQAGVPSQKIEDLARKDGVDFKVTADIERDLRKAGASASLIQLLKQLGNQSPATTSSSPLVASPVTGEIQTLLHTAQDAINKRDFPEAVKALKGVVAQQPGIPEAWFNLGYAYTALHEPDEAVAAYRKTLEIAPDLFQARLNLGILLMEQKQPQAALEHLQKASVLKPDHARAHLYYARALAQTGQPAAAAKEFQQAARLDPRLATAQYELGQMQLEQKHAAEALAAFQQALTIDPTLTQAELGAALAAEATNDPAQAAAHFEKYLASRPDDVETQFHLARLYLQQNQTEKAHDTLLPVYKVRPDLPGLTAALGDVCARLKNLPQAEKYYQLAVAAQPGVVDLHRAYGEILLKEQKFPEAQAQFMAALKLDSHNRDAAIGLASCLDLQKKYAEAIPILEQLAKQPDAAPYVFFVLATCYDHLMARKEALASYEHFLQISHGAAPDQEWQATQRAKLLRRELSK